MKQNVTYTEEKSRFILKVEDLKVWFPIRGGVLQRIVNYVRAVDGVNFMIEEGKTLGLVGESGSGKTTIAKTVIGLIKPVSGNIYFNNVNIPKASKKDLKYVRRKMQMIFQDPYASLDPRQTIGSSLLEAMKIHKLYKSKDIAYSKAVELLERVGLGEEHLYRFPHELSGGQRQRVAIARALVTNPTLLILDEPTSFLDVSIQASVLNLLMELQDSLNLSYLFISHNLAVINYVSDIVAVMYLGKIMEIAEKTRLFTDPKHPYTYQLIESIPSPNPEEKKDRKLTEGEIPSILNIPSGCRYHTRCPYATDKCSKEEPLLEKKEDRYTACHYDLNFRI